MMLRRAKMWGGVLLLTLLFAAAYPFIDHAAGRGWRGLTSDADSIAWMFRGAGMWPNLSIFAHMLIGAVITGLAFVQLCSPIRTYLPQLHRWSGRAMVAGCLITSLGGLIYIAMAGTIGGSLMSFGFALYGLLMALSAVQAIRHARARRFDVHRRWGLRLAVLALGSWIYRVHYSVWYATTGGWGIEPGFTGPFDQFQIFAFYLPYLLVLEIVFRLTAERRVSVPSPSS